MDICLSELLPGERALVITIPESCPLKGRLRDFGMVEGTQVACQFFSPGGDLAALELRGTVIALRRGDLGQIVARRHL